VYAKTFDVKLKATVKELEKLEASGEASLKEEVSTLRQELDNTSSRLEMRLKTTLLGLQTMPCDQEARKEFWAAMKLVNDKTDELEKILAAVKSPAAPSSLNTIRDSMESLSQGFELQ